MFFSSASRQQNLKVSSSSEDEPDDSPSNQKVRPGVDAGLKVRQPFLVSFQIFFSFVCFSVALSGETQEEAGEDGGPAGQKRGTEEAAQGSGIFSGRVHFK